MKTKECTLAKAGGLPAGRSAGPRAGLEAGRGLDRRRALSAAGECLVNRSCSSCDLCQLLCPDLALSRNLKTGKLEVNYDLCKGCGICAFVCPRGAIRMVSSF